ncbi:hypothetical protein HID58_060551 [Brassica napus]|uniref:BnaC04g55170D protein n=2 Tax=Brassica napus TaxID=3708 RepID=A0A078IKJ7_BRANA|nr:hypothetical protein HID58_060551 [Brassica napus]CAF1844890.1 unnamed protein product [Brassica napus]CDY49583.1 BnaC04g55170D [Brassica napus]
MGPVKNQGNHEVCWALVLAELVSVVRYVRGHDRVKVDYSIQDIVDFTNKEERRLRKDTGHYCYPWYIHSGLEYVKRCGVQREEDRPFQVNSCTKNVAPRDPLSKLTYISKVIHLRTIEDTLTVLHEHPVAAEIPIFVPEYTNIGNKIYRGPTTSSSVFTSMHAVNIIGAATEENGEKNVYVRSSHGETLGVNGNLKVSIEIMMMCLTPDIGNEFGKYPRSLIDMVVYPETCPESGIIDVDPPEHCIISIF